MTADPEAAHVLWQKAREALYRGHPSSPVPAERRPEFRSLHFAYDPGLRFELPLVVDTPAAVRPGGPVRRFAPLSRFGASPCRSAPAKRPSRSNRLARRPLPGGIRRLAVFWLREYSGGIFLPFRDATNGTETYGGGRYLLDTAKGADLGGDTDCGTIVVDFNFAYQPSCAFDPRWSCPLAPPENRLDVEIRAGERIA